MIFSNRLDKIEILESLDETEFSKYTLAKDGWTTSVSFATPEKIDKYRYVTVNNRLYTLTSFSQGEDGTEITATSFANKKSEVIDVGKGSYTLKELLERITPVVTVVPSDAALPKIEIKEDKKSLHDAINDCISSSSAYISIESVLSKGDAMNLYGIQLTIIDIGWESYQSADILLPIGDVNTQLDANPQYDKSYKISQSISNINSISDLRSWKEVMSPTEYQSISDYISNDQSTVTEADASKTLMNCIEFKRANFQKVSGEEFIINANNDEENDDGIAYKMEDVPFSTYAVTKNRIIQNIFNQYQGFTIKNIETLQEVRDQIIISADAKNLYITQNYEIDCKTFVISSADFKLVNTLEEFPDDKTEKQKLN